MDIKQIIRELREKAQQNLIDRDWWEITESDVSEEMQAILIQERYGRIK